MSELSEAISEMRNMRESYDQIGAAAESYNTGKAELAANITAKGVQASASETLPELAEKVAAISQESYTIDGGEMYAKQLFGALDTPNYWNLYEVLMQLLSDGRLVNYGGILLAEYYKGYASLALSGAGAGGAYVVSDKDANGDFIMYTNDTTHTWATEFDGKGNRWVAYCFADEYHDFQITDTDTSPHSIFIGRKVGTVTSLVSGRCSQVVVPDGNELVDFRGNYTQSWGREVIFRNIQNHNTGVLMWGVTGTESLFVSAKRITSSVIGYNSSGTLQLKTLIIKCEELSPTTGLFGGNSYSLTNLNTLIIFGDIINCYLTAQYPSFNGLRDVVIKASSGFFNYTDNLYISNHTLWLYYETNNGKFTIKGGKATAVTRLILQNEWCKTLNIKACTSLNKENVQEYIFDRLGVNDLSTGAVTITLATAVLNLFTQEEIDAVVERTNITIVGA